MSNPRDTGRYDQFTDTWSGDEVRVDFAWGNIPMQPDDDREVTLDDTLDSHIIATSGYEGFPAFITGAPYDDTVQNVTVPSVVGSTLIQATSALQQAGLVVNEATSTVGATSGNNNKIKEQSIAAGTVVNRNTAVTITKYVYVAPITTGPISGFNRTSAGTSFSLNGNQSIMYVIGQTVKPTVGDTISVTGSDDVEHNVSWTVNAVENNNSYNTGGTAVKVTLVTGTITSSTATGGTWTKI